MSLSTGKQLHCYQWTELPVPDHVVDRVEEMAALEDQPIMTNGPIFEWGPGVPILYEDEATDEEEGGEAPGLDYDDTDDEESDDEAESDDEEPVVADQANEVSHDEDDTINQR